MVIEGINCLVCQVFLVFIGVLNDKKQKKEQEKEMLNADQLMYDSIHVHIKKKKSIHADMTLQLCGNLLSKSNFQY